MSSSTRLVSAMLGLLTTLILMSSLPTTNAHIAMFHPSMWGFNVTMQDFPYDNRPVAPLINDTFEEWWFHGHLAYPPNPGDIFSLPAGSTATTELGCNKGATSYFASSDGGDIIDPNDPENPCPGAPISEFHTLGLDDVKGCALAIAYESNVTQIQPQDFTVFSVNHTCVWTRHTDFQVPQNMPACPDGGCICAWFWIHSPDSGSEQNYMNGFRCNVTGATSTVPLAEPQVARRCGADPANGVEFATPGNCTYGAKQPLYWFQAQENNMFEGTYAPPFYTDLYNFRDGAQDDIFQDSYKSIPTPGPYQTELPLPNNLPGGLQLITSDPGEPVNSSMVPVEPSSPSSVALPSSSSSTTEPTAAPANTEAPEATVTVTDPAYTVTVTVGDSTPSTTPSTPEIPGAVEAAPTTATAPPGSTNISLNPSGGIPQGHYKRNDQRAARSLARRAPYTDGEDATASSRRRRLPRGNSSAKAAWIPARGHAKDVQKWSRRRWASAMGLSA